MTHCYNYLQISFFFSMSLLERENPK